MQDIGFLTPLEVEHAIFRSSNGDSNEVVGLLQADGYQEAEVDRVVSQSLGREVIYQSGDRLFVKDSRVGFARRLLIIDLVAISGEHLNTIEGRVGNVLIPGYGALYGAQLGRISSEIDNFAPNSNYTRNDFAQDITWLTEEKFIILS